MFFGLTNSPATFQAFMNSIFAPLVTKGVVNVYLDDIIIFAKTLDHLQEITLEVLAILEKYDLFLRPQKCEFEKQEIEYLGLIIRPSEVAMDPGKVRAITEWKTPTTLKEVQAALGFGNFYRRFYPNLANVVKPLTDLTKKNEPFVWTRERQTAWEAFKDGFSKEPVLKLYEEGRETRVIIDASNVATGGILQQKCEDGKWHPIAYRSSLMSPEERNYAIYDREMLALVRALEDWRHFLEGQPEFEVLMDHKNMEWWAAMQNLNRRQARWALYLSRFIFKI
jgi:hypothetical protein